MCISDLLLKILTDYRYLFIVFAFFSLVFHLVLFCCDVPNVVWKLIEWVGIFVAVIGLSGMISANRIYIANNQIKIYQSRVSAALEEVRKRFDRTNGHYFDNKFERTMNSPDNFDEIVEQFRIASDWLKSIQDQIPQSNSPPFHRLNFSDLNFPDSIYVTVLLNNKLRMSSAIDYYNESLDEFTEIQAKTKRSEFEFLWTFISPLFLCIALASRLTELTAEIRRMIKADVNESN